MNSNIDRNQAIGLVLISGILIAYFTFFSPTPPVENTSKSTTKAISASTTPDSIKAIAQLDSVAVSKNYGSLANNVVGKSEQILKLENENIAVLISTKGAKVVDVLLKKYKTYARKELHLVQPTDIKINLSAQNIDFDNVVFSVKSSDDAKIILAIQSDAGDDIQVEYTLPKDAYTLNYNINSLKLNAPVDSLTLSLKADFPLIEKDFANARQTANVTYRQMDGTYNSLNEASNDKQTQNLTSNAHWVTFKQKFFSIAFIAPNGVYSTKLGSSVDLSDTSIVKSMFASMKLSVADINAGKGKYTYYFGPNKLNIVSPIADDFKENVYLGWPIIRTINRYTIAPLFTFLEKFVSNYGIIIILIVLIIKIVLFPLSYKAYYSMAKMKVLKPELDEIKARVGDDMAAMQQEQMKLYQSVGVNPLSGCIPVLMQMPILLTLFNFFPNAIELRQQPFLWAEDLSTFDNICNLPFAIPFYGDHVSLFALLMTASTILYTWYNSQMNVSATGPMIAMSYIMPVIFLFVMNSFPAGLSFYYFVANMITIGQQYIIKQFVDETAIRAQLEQNKISAPERKPNRFQQRLMDAMEQQKALKQQQASKKK